MIQWFPTPTPPQKKKKKKKQVYIFIVNDHGPRARGDIDLKY